ncbi:hypothetical protein J6590_029841 [Homalodisca vitripennis]|nr:hypothetical protein J6590_029841 [Homalodisca vitripennis]
MINTGDIVPCYVTLSILTTQSTSSQDKGHQLKLAETQQGVPLVQTSNIDSLGPGSNNSKLGKSNTYKEPLRF